MGMYKYSASASLPEAALLETDHYVVLRSDCIFTFGY